MPPFDWFVRASVVLAFALLEVLLLQRRSAVARRLVLTVAFAAVLVIPLLPAWHVGGPTVHALVGRLVAEPSVAGPKSGAVLGRALELSAFATSSVANWRQWLGVAWAVGAFFVGSRFLLGLVLAHRLAKRASPATEAWGSIIERAERASGVRAEVRVSSEIDAPALAVFLLLDGDSPGAAGVAAPSGWLSDRRSRPSRL